MLRNYFKIGLRNIMKNKMAAFINAFGLALAVGCCLVVFKFASWYFNRDVFHENRESIYVVERLVNEDGNLGYWGDTPEPLGPALKEDWATVENQTRYTHSGGIFRYQNQVFNEWITFVDDSFYEIFDFPVKWGDPATFGERQGIVLSERAAERYFGERNPVGEQITIRFNINGKDQDEKFTVQGVFDAFPKSATFSFNILLPYERKQQIFPENFNEWDQHTAATFLLIRDPGAAEKLPTQIGEYVNRYNANNDKNWKTERFHLQPLTKMLAHSVDVNRSTFDSAHIAGLIMLVIIVLALLSLACFNYMNIAVASASTRVKEIGVRKVMGGNRPQIVVQFLVENLILCTGAVFLGVLMANFLFFPWFNSISDFHFVFSLDLTDNVWIWLFILSLIGITTLGGTAYPAFYISSFLPVTVLSNKLKFGGKKSLPKNLIGTAVFPFLFSHFLCNCLFSS